jgi:hypothetical protein
MLQRRGQRRLRSRDAPVGNANSNLVRPAYMMARKLTSHASAQQATLVYAEWKAKALTLLGSRAGTMPERKWKRAFVAGMSPDEAAALTATNRRNVVVVDSRRRRRGEPSGDVL